MPEITDRTDSSSDWEPLEDGEGHPEQPESLRNGGTAAGRWHHDENRCWFCGGNDIGASETYYVISGVRELTLSRTKRRVRKEVSYKSEPVNLPRCSSCATAHRRHAWGQALGIIVGTLVAVLLVYVPYYLVTGGEDDGPAAIVVFALMFAAVFMGYYIGRAIATLPRGVKEYSAWKDYPPLAKAISLRKQVGKHPRPPVGSGLGDNERWRNW